MVGRLLRLGILLSSFVFAGCGGDPNDPLSWVEKLDRGAERQEAIEKIRAIYRDELNKNDGNHDAASVKALAAKLAPGVIDAARKYKDDRESRVKMIELLGELRDRRAIPLFIEALDFTPELTEDEACAGADGLGFLRAREGVQPMVKLLARITGNRAADNRMKRSVVVAFGTIKDPEAVPALIELLDKSADEQDFLINKLAAIALGDIGDPRAVPVLIRALYMAGRGATIYQQARVSLAQIGAAAVPALTKALRRQDPELNQMARQLTFDCLSPGILEEKCAKVLGDIGDASAIDALLEVLPGGSGPPGTGEVCSEADKAAGAPGANRDVKAWQAPVRGNVALALIRLARTDADINRVVDAILPLASELPETAHSDLYQALARSGQQRALDFLENRMNERPARGEVVRFWAADWFAHFGHKGVKAKIEHFFAAEPEGVRTELAADVERIQAKANASEECDTDVACWSGKLADARLGGQAADRLGILGSQGSQPARDALLAQTDNADIDVRRTVLDGLDHAYADPCPPCVTRLDAIVAAEQGRQRLAVSHNDMAVIASRMRRAGGPAKAP
jgi:HEAT repeat protein